MSAVAVVAVIVGIVLLVIGAEWLVRGAARLAARTGLSHVVIGLTVVAFGTSAPELAVSVGDVLRGDDGGSIAIGNVIGSNIANILLALGLAAAVGGSLVVAQRIVRIDVPIVIGVSVLFLVFALDGELGRVEGFVLVGGLIVYLTWTVLAARRGTITAVALEYEEALAEEKLIERAAWFDVLVLLAGLGCLVAGAQALVVGASDIATDLGVSDLVIGLTVVAIGTSLPEVATTVVAALRGQRDLAVGNAIGSNLFNLLAVLGITAAVSPTSLPIPDSALQVDLPVMIAVAVACLPIFVVGHVLQRWEGVTFFVLYLLYIGWLVLDASEYARRDSYSTVVLFLVLPITAITMGVVWYRAHRAGQEALARAASDRVMERDGVTGR